MDGANGNIWAFSGRVRLEEEMGTFSSGGLHDHACRVMGINAAVLPYAVGIDHVDIQMQAASSAANTDHAG